jgi:bacterioferritin (cytochrome b1)
MKAANPQIIEDLQTSAQMLAHLAGQYQVDVQNLKCMGVKWVANHVRCWYKGSEEQLRRMIKRLFQFGVDPEYDAGAVAGADTIDEILDRAEGLVTAAHDQMCVFRYNAYQAKPDYTSDIYEHAIHELEHQLTHIERERELIKKMGEASYVGARLEDGD